ncbi:MAG: hypothetical protein ACK4NX_01815, partial [Candidatus Paceibacteria bacterium]
MSDISKKRFIPLSEAAKNSPYSQEYLSLLARKKKIFAKKIGRNWYTTREAIEDYLRKQGLTILIPKDQLPDFRSRIQKAVLTASLAEEFEKLNLPLESAKESVEKEPPKIEASAPLQKPQEVSLPEAEKISLPSAGATPVFVTNETLTVEDKNIFEKLDEIKEEIKKAPTASLTPEQKEFVDLSSQGFWFKFKKFNLHSRELVRDPRKTLIIMVGAIVFLFLLAGGFSFGQIDNAVQRVRQIFDDAQTLQGHFPGTHANEVLLLDKAGNISIYGHIETQGQLRSYAPTGVAPIVVDSITKVENLNADYLDDLDSKDFTLAFVTKNGNITYEDVFLEGNVEVGKTLLVKGATKLLDSLTVYGELGVFGQAVFGKDVKLTGGSVEILKGNLILDSGTIKISNRAKIDNLNADLLDDLHASDFTLDRVIGFGNTAYRPAFFEAGLWAKDGAFGSLGVAGDASVGKQDNPDASLFTVYSKRFQVDSSGNLKISGKATLPELSVTRVVSDLSPSGSYDLGSSTNRWVDVFVTNLNINGQLVASGSVNFAGTSSASFVINT